MAFLKKALKWLSPGVEPSEEKKQQGFQNGEFPSAGHFDFMFKSTADAIGELQQKAGEVKTVNGQVPNANGNVVVNTDTSTLATKDELTTHKLDNAKHGVVGVATGTNTLVMPNSDVTAYTDMMLVAFKNTTESTEATTLNINNLGAKAIVKANGNAVTNLKANAIYQVRYSGSNFHLLGEGGEYGTATASDVLSGKTIGTESGLVSGTLSKGKGFLSGTVIGNNTGITSIATNANFDIRTILIRWTAGVNTYIATWHRDNNLSVGSGAGEFRVSDRITQVTNNDIIITISSRPAFVINGNIITFNCALLTTQSVQWEIYE